MQWIDECRHDLASGLRQLLAAPGFSLVAILTLALGSMPGGIAALLLRQGGAWMAVGVVGGALGVVAITRFVRSLLYGVQPFDPLTLGTAAGLVVVCAALALAVPMRRVCRLNPVTALRL